MKKITGISRFHALHVERQATREGRTSESGDTLVEILITLMVLGVTSVAIMGAFTMALKATSQYRTVATLNTAITTASQNVLSQIQQQANPLYSSCATPSIYNSGSNSVNFGAPSGYVVQVTDVTYFNSTTGLFTTSCTPGSTAPQEISLMATSTASGTSASIDVVVDNRSGALLVSTQSQTLSVSASPSQLPWSSTSTVSASGQSGTGAVSYLVDTGSNGQTSLGSCSVNSAAGVVSAQGAGTCYVYATIASDSAYSAATSSDVAITFTKVPQTLVVSASPSVSNWSTANLGFTAPGTGTVTYQVVGSTGTSLTDLAGNNPAVIPSNATGVALGAAGPTLIGGTAVSFSGATGSYLETTQPFDSSATAAAGSISIWFNTRSSGPIMGASNLQTDASPTNWDRMLWVDSAGHLVGGVYNNYTYVVISKASVSDGQWHLATLTWGSPNGETLYLDGNMVATNSKGTSAQIYGGGTGYWHIGYNTRNSWPDNNTNNINYFIGSLAGAAAYPSELTPTQVQSLYAATSVASENSTTLGLSPTSYWPLNDGACTIPKTGNPQQIVASSPGMCYFSGSIAADANYLAATSVVASVELAPSPQSITATDTAKTNDSGQITSYIISSANSLGTGTISYRIDPASSDGSCQLSGGSNNNLTATSGVTCNVYVTIAADSLYAGATSADLPLIFPSNNNGVTISASGTNGERLWSGTDVLNLSKIPTNAKITITVVVNSAQGLSNPSCWDQDGSLSCSAQTSGSSITYVATGSYQSWFSSDKVNFQYNPNGASHNSAQDTWIVTSTQSGVTSTQTGHF